MNFELYLKQDIEKVVFVEFTKDITLNTSKNKALPKGEYPILPEDIVYLAKEGLENIPIKAIIDAMLYIIACDRTFKYNKLYIEVLKNIEEIRSYIINQIKENQASNLKKATIFVTALTRLYEEKEYKYNRVLLLMELFETFKQEFVKEEIVASLEALTEEYKEFKLPFYHLGEYYIDIDKDKAKLYLNECIGDNVAGDEAQYLLNKMESVEKYDQAVDNLKKGNTLEALRVLIPFCEENPENLDAKFYTAVAYRQYENSHKALMYLTQLESYGETIELCNEFGLNLAALGDFQGAYEYFKKALKLKPDSSDIISNMGACKLNLGELEEAKKAFELALRLNSKDEAALMWMEYIKNNY